MHANIAFADGFKAVVDTKSANAGDIVDINVSLENNSGIIAALFNAEYDRERLELTEVRDGLLLDGGTFSPSYTAYPYKMVWNSASDKNFTDDGILVTLTFKVLENASSGKAYVNLTYSENDVFDVDLNNTPIEVVSGGIDVSGISSEDADFEESREKFSNAAEKNSHGTASEKTLNEQIILTIGEKEALVFGEKKVNDVAPIIRNDRTMLPARFVAENLGAEVKWDGDSEKVTITKDDITIVVTIDSQTALVNGAAVVLDSPAFIENDRTYTPLRFVAEKLGADVEWNETDKKVVITK